MTKKTKRWLFYSAVAVFLLLSYISIIYAQGYKYSFSENKFLRTGAISLKVNIGAKVYLDDQFQGDTSFFNSAYSIDRLLPGKYKITIIRDDYSSWQTTATVEEGLVADFPHILILPEEGEEEQKLFNEIDELFKKAVPISLLSNKPTPKTSPKTSISPAATQNIEPFFIDKTDNKLFENNKDAEPIEIAQNVKGFRLSENKNKLAWWTANELWILWLNDQNYQPFHKAGNMELITRFSIQIQNAIWFRGEDHLVLELERFDLKNRPYSIYQVIEIDKRGGVNIIEL